MDQEITEEILEKTAKVEKRQKNIQTELKRSRSRESSYINEFYNNDDTVSSKMSKKNCESEEDQK